MERVLPDNASWNNCIPGRGKRGIFTRQLIDFTDFPQYALVPYQVCKHKKTNELLKMATVSLINDEYKYFGTIVVPKYNYSEDEYVDLSGFLCLPEKTSFEEYLKELVQKEGTLYDQSKVEERYPTKGKLFPEDFGIISNINNFSCWNFKKFQLDKDEAMVVLKALMLSRALKKHYPLIYKELTNKE